MRNNTRNSKESQTEISKGAVAITEVLNDGSIAKIKYKMVHSSELRVDPTYQLPLNQKRVDMILKEFDPRLVNPIKVSPRLNHYYIIDGQHTENVLIIRNNGKDLPVLCKVYYGLTVKQEAYLFAKQNGYTRTPSFNATASALRISGAKDMTEFFNLTERAGFRFNIDSPNVSPFKINATKKAYTYYEKLGADSYLDMLMLLKELYHGDPDSLRNSIIGGFGMFYFVYAGQFVRRRLFEKLMTVPPLTIIREAGVYRKGGDARFAKIILDRYNYKLASNRLPDGPIDKKLMARN